MIKRLGVWKRKCLKSSRFRAACDGCQTACGIVMCWSLCDQIRKSVWILPCMYICVVMLSIGNRSAHTSAIYAETAAL
jgi:hypothetical protein